MASGYSALQQPDGGYGPSQSPPSAYSAATQQTAAPAQQAAAPAQPAAPAATRQNPQLAADKMVDEIRKLYVGKFRILGTKIGSKIPITPVSPDQLQAEQLKDVEDKVTRMVRARLRFNRDLITGKIKFFFYLQKIPVPPEYQNPDENTQFVYPGLNEFIRKDYKDELIESLKEDPEMTAGFYSRPKKDRHGKDIGRGRIYVRMDLAEDPDKRHHLAGAVAHELAHAYAHDLWHDFIEVLQATSKRNSDALQEGMPVQIERMINQLWNAGGGAVPITGYLGQPMVWTTGARLIADVGERAAMDAYFSGSINVNFNKFDQGIKLGGKLWKWPW